MADLSIYALGPADSRTFPPSLVRGLTHRMRQCSACGGAGYEWAPGGNVPCSACHGAKEIECCIECGCDLPCGTHGRRAA